MKQFFVFSPPNLGKSTCIACLSLTWFSITSCVQAFTAVDAGLEPVGEGCDGLCQLVLWQARPADWTAPEDDLGHEYYSPVTLYRPGSPQKKYSHGDCVWNFACWEGWRNFHITETGTPFHPEVWIQLYSQQCRRHLARKLVTLGLIYGRKLSTLSNEGPPSVVGLTVKELLTIKVRGLTFTWTPCTIDKSTIAIVWCVILLTRLSSSALTVWLFCRIRTCSVTTPFHVCFRPKCDNYSAANSANRHLAKHTDSQHQVYNSTWSPQGLGCKFFLGLLI